MNSWRASSLIAVLALLPLAAPGPLTAQVSPDLLDALEARSIGPAVMSGRIAAIAGVPGDPKTIYVGAATSGVWKTEDAGTTWTPVFDEQDVSSIGAITVHPANPELVWVGTGEANLRNSSGVGRGIYKSLDGGKTWEKTGLEGTEHIHRIAVHPTNPDVAYVAATGSLWRDGGPRGLYKTTDGGETWSRVLEGPNARTGAVEVVMDPENPLKLFASLWEFRRWPYFFESGGEGSGLYVTHDGGRSWKEITHEDGLPRGPLGRIGVDVAPSDPDYVYALVEAERSVFARSTDGGETWEVVNRERGVAQRPFYYGRIMVDPENRHRVYNIHGTLEASIDGGEEFEGIATWGGGVHVDHHALWIDPEDADVVVDGNDGGVYISRNRGESWRFVENLPFSQFYELDVDDQIPYNVYGGLQDNGSWRGPAEVWESNGIRDYHWEEIGFGDGFGAMDDPNDPRYGYSMSQQGFLRRFDLVTGERRDIRPAPPADTIELRFNWNSPLALDPFDDNTLYYGSQYVHESTDDGMSWEVISPDLTTDNPEWQKQDESGGLTLDVTGAENYTTLYTIAPSPVERGVIWTGSDDGLVHVTRDGGGSWRNVTGNLPGLPDNPWVSHIEASKFDGATAFAVIHNYMKGDWSTYVYRTTNYGEDWTRIADREVDGFARTLEQDPEVPGLLYLGTEFGLYVTLDGGRTWTKWTHGVPTVPVRALATQTREHDLVLGTHGRGVYIIDDVRPLRALARDPSVRNEALRLFASGPAYVHTVAPPRVYRFDGDAMFRGENEPYGMEITFWADTTRLDLPAEDDEEEGAGPEEAGPEERSAERGGPSGGEDEDEKPEIRWQVLEADSVVREEEVEVDQGLVRFFWNLRRTGFRIPGGGGPFGGGDDDRGPGPEVLPGSYTLRLVAGRDTVSRAVEVKADPRVDIPMAEREAKFSALMRLGRSGEVATDAVERIREAKEGADRVLELIGKQEDPAAHDSLKSAAKELKESLVDLEERLVGPDREVQGIGPDVETVADDLRSAYFSLASSYDAPTSTQRIKMERALAGLREAVERTNELFETEVADFRRQAAEAGLEAFPPAPEEPLTLPDGG